MSINTWKKKYYPVNATAYLQHTAYSQLEAAKHCLKKWKGLRQANLMEHHVTLDCGNIAEQNVHSFVNDGESCALCQWNSSSTGYGKCESCVLAKVRGGVSCARSRHNEDMSPFAALQRHNNPEPMIFWLKKAVKLAEKRQL